MKFKKIIGNKYIQKAFIGALAGLLGINLAGCYVSAAKLETETELGTIKLGEVKIKKGVDPNEEKETQ